jgi:hypothetical protein
MKKNYFLLLAFLLFAFGLNAQIKVNQVIVGTGGIYGNPDDHVSLSGYNPETQTSDLIGGVVRESMQDIVISDGFAYLTAEDSIVKFDLQNKTKVAAVYESNLNRLLVSGDRLYVSRRSDLNGAPLDGFYLKVFNAETLELEDEVAGISSDASAMVLVYDTLYLAVPGDWQATEGRMAVIDQDMNLVQEINLGADAVGLTDLFADDENVYSVNRTPYLGTTGSITSYQISSGLATTNVVNNVFGKGFAKNGNLLYLIMDYGIGAYDLTTNQVAQTAIVPDPGSASYEYISAAAFDYINQLFYVAIGDYYSMGVGKVYDLQSNETDTFEAGISTTLQLMRIYSDGEFPFSLIQLLIQCKSGRKIQLMRFSFLINWVS